MASDIHYTVIPKRCRYKKCPAKPEILVTVKYWTAWRGSRRFPVYEMDSWACEEHAKDIETELKAEVF